MVRAYFARFDQGLCLCLVFALPSNISAPVMAPRIGPEARSQVMGGPACSSRSSRIPGMTSIAFTHAHHHRAGFHHALLLQYLLFQCPWISPLSRFHLSRFIRFPNNAENRNRLLPGENESRVRIETGLLSISLHTAPGFGLPGGRSSADSCCPR